MKDDQKNTQPTQLFQVQSCKFKCKTNTPWNILKWGIKGFDFIEMNRFHFWPIYEAEKKMKNV